MQRRSFLARLAAASALAACAPLSVEKIRLAVPPIGRFVEVDGLPVHYWDRGDGPPVILLHGASGNLRDWTFDIAPRLAGRYRVVAFDRPGFGYSARIPERGWDPAVQAAHLHRAAELLGLERPVVVGHSLGGAIAMAWGVLFADEIRGLVPVAGATMPWDGGVSLLYDLGASPVLGPLTGEIASRVASRSLVADWIARTFRPQPVPAGYIDYVGWQLATRPATFRQNARDMDHLSAGLARQARFYPQMHAPVEIVQGTADPVVDVELQARRLHALLPDSHLVLLDGMGHMPHHFAFGPICAAIDRLARA